MFKYRIDRIPQPKQMPHTIRGSDTLLHAGNEYRHLWKTFHTYFPKQGEVIVMSVWHEKSGVHKPQHWKNP